MEISEPAELASIPSSHVGNGKKFYTQVYGLVGGRKRKRQEISVAVDGDSINIYEVRTGYAYYNLKITDYPRFEMGEI